MIRGPVGWKSNRAPSRGGDVSSAAFPRCLAGRPLRSSRAQFVGHSRRPNEPTDRVGELFGLLETVQLVTSVPNDLRELVDLGVLHAELFTQVPLTASETLPGLAVRGRLRLDELLVGLIVTTVRRVSLLAQFLTGTTRIGQFPLDFVQLVDVKAGQLAIGLGQRTLGDVQIPGQLADPDTLPTDLARFGPVVAADVLQGPFGVGRDPIPLTTPMQRSQAVG